MQSEPLTLREEPQLRDLTVRTITLRAASLDETTRSVEAVCATEDMVQVLDMQRWEVIEEILRMDGLEPTEDVPLLANHDRWSLDSILGSARTFRVENGQVLGRLHFAEGDEDSDKAYNKVRQGHVRNVSAGYRSLEFVDIPAGQTAIVKGRSYTAGKRTLRVTTRWELREVSLVPIGADKRSKIRADQPTPNQESPVNPQLRAFLESIGLRKEATDQEAQAFYSKLNANDKARADAAAVANPTTPPPTQRTEPPNPPPAQPPAPVAAQQQRSEPPVVQPPANPNNPPPATDAARAAADAAIATERTRVRSLRELAGDDVPREMLTRAIDEGWDESRASREFLTAVRGSRRPGAPTTAPAGDPSYRPGLQSVADPNVRALGMGLMLRENGSINPVEAYREFHEGIHRPIANPNQNQDLLRAADQAWQYREMSLVDLCREACRLEFGRVPSSRSECIRSAVSGSTLTAIFSVNVNAQLIQGWSDAEDTTDGWCSEADCQNFLTQERAQMGKFGQLRKLAKGKKAEHLDIDDKKEEYKIARYAGQFALDEIDIVNDRWGALEQMSPIDMGLTARQLRPNLVYSILLANEALSDAVALFHSTHGNTTTGALAAATLQASITLMGKHRKGRANDAAGKRRPLNVKPRFLIVTQDNAFLADQLLNSVERFNNSENGSRNPLQGRQIQVRVDDRIGAAGCWDPNAEVVRTGTATNYFLAARPGEEGAKTIEVGYLRGTGRMPQVRPFVRTQGEWGLGWDINLDIGGKALDHQGFVFSTGAP